MKNNDDDEWFIIDNLDKFVESTRVLVFDAFGKENKKSTDDIALLISDLDTNEIEELDQTITQSECMVIAKNYVQKQLNKTKKTIQYLITNKKYMEMIESINARMISNLLSQLVNKGLIESAYDAEANDFVFWIKENNEKQDQKPETD